MFYLKKKTKLFGDFAPTSSPGHHPGPPRPLRPPAAIILASSKIDASIFLLQYPLAGIGIWKVAIPFDNLLRKAYFLLKIGFQVVAFFIVLEVGYLIIIVANFAYKGAQKLFLENHKIMTDWFMFSEYFSNWLCNFIMVMWLYFFSKWDTKIIAFKFWSAKYMWR